MVFLAVIAVIEHGIMALVREMATLSNINTNNTNTNTNPDANTNVLMLMLIPRITISSTKGPIVYYLPGGGGGGAGGGGFLDNIKIEICTPYKKLRTKK